MRRAERPSWGDGEHPGRQRPRQRGCVIQPLRLAARQQHAERGNEAGDRTGRGIEIDMRALSAEDAPAFVEFHQNVNAVAGDREGVEKRPRKAYADHSGESKQAQPAPGRAGIEDTRGHSGRRA